MIIGFTGTSDGMTVRQAFYLPLAILKETRKIKPSRITALHGDCIGADDEFQFLLQNDIRILMDWGQIDGFKLTIEIHPSNIESKRAFNKGDIIYEPQPPLERNPDIVRPCDILFATPKEMKEIIRSGTWATIRYARKMKKKITIIYPDGSVGN